MSAVSGRAKSQCRINKGEKAKKIDNFYISNILHIYNIQKTWKKGKDRLVRASEDK